MRPRGPRGVERIQTRRNLSLRGYGIAVAASLTGCVETDYGAASGKKKTQYGVPRAPERAPFRRGVEGSSPHPSLKEQSEGRGAYFVLGSDVREWYVFRLTSFASQTITGNRKPKTME